MERETPDTRKTKTEVLSFSREQNKNVLFDKENCQRPAFHQAKGLEEGPRSKYQRPNGNRYEDPQLKTEISINSNPQWALVLTNMNTMIISIWDTIARNTWKFQETCKSLLESSRNHPNASLMVAQQMRDVL